MKSDFGGYFLQCVGNHKQSATGTRENHIRTTDHVIQMFSQKVQLRNSWHRGRSSQPFFHQISTDSINVVFCCSNIVTVVLPRELHIYAAVLTAGGCRSCGLFCEAHLHDVSLNRGQFQRRRDENVGLLFLHRSP